jgi:hypothetical protein
MGALVNATRRGQYYSMLPDHGVDMDKWHWAAGRVNFLLGWIAWRTLRNGYWEHRKRAP